MRGAIYVLVCYIMWGLLPVYWKMLSQVNSLYVLASRMLWSFVFCILIAAYKKELGEMTSILRDRTTMKRIFAGGFLVAVNWGLYIAVVQAGKIVDASLAYYMNPIISVVLGAVFFREKLSRRQSLAVALALAGVAVPVVLYGKLPIYAILIGGSFAVYGALKKQMRIKSEISLSLETLTMIPLTAAYMIFAKAKGIDGADSLKGASILLLPLTGIATSVPLLLFNEGIKTTSMATAGVLMYVNPTLQLILGAIFYREPLSSANIITFAFIWAALIIYVPTVLREARVRGGSDGV